MLGFAITGVATLGFVMLHPDLSNSGHVPGSVDTVCFRPHVNVQQCFESA